MDVRTFAALAVLLLAGCSASAASQPTVAPTRPAAATVQVRVGLFGGPLGHDGREALNNSPAQGQRVTLVGVRGARHRARTDAHGITAFSVPPGHYVLTWPICDGRRHLSAYAGHTTRVAVHCAVP